MDRLTREEERILEQYINSDFKGISRENNTTLASILVKLDPEVAKELIEQMPEAIKGMNEIEKIYDQTMTKSVDALMKSEESCFGSEDRIIEALSQELAKDIPFEQKQYYVEEMVGASRRKGDKDSEHRETIVTIVKYGFFALGAGLLFLGGMFLGGSNDD